MLLEIRKLKKPDGLHEISRRKTGRLLNTAAVFGHESPAFVFVRC